MNLNACYRWFRCSSFLCLSVMHSSFFDTILHTLILYTLYLHQLWVSMYLPFISTNYIRSLNINTLMCSYILWKCEKRVHSFSFSLRLWLLLWNSWVCANLASVPLDWYYLYWDYMGHSYNRIFIVVKVHNKLRHAHYTNILGVCQSS